jgi:hypothetical protein
MKGPSVSQGLRLIQVFLSQSATTAPGIYEVSLDDDKEALSCTCPGFQGRNVCKHTKFVKARIDTNNGTYPLEISSRATKEDAESAKKSNKHFREFVIRFGKIEVY